MTLIYLSLIVVVISRRVLVISHIFLSNQVRTMASTKKPTYKKEPEKFPWEAPPPTGPFWSDIREGVAAQFLTIYGADGLAKLNLDPSLSKDEKLAHLRQNLERKLADAEAATPPSQMTEDEFKLDRRMYHALASTYTEQKQWEAAHEVAKRMTAACEARNGRPDLGALSTLAWTAERIGEYALADQYCAQSLPYLKTHELLGPDSPQVLGTMRLRMLVLGKVGRILEAKELNRQGYAVIESMKGGKFEKYHDEEVEAMDELKVQLEKAEASNGTIPEDWQPLESA